MNRAKIRQLSHFAVSIISKDRPGIVADTTEVLYRLGCNIEDSSCTMLGGDFAIILIVSHEKPFLKSRLSEEFRTLQERTGLVVHLRTLHEEELSPPKDEGELCLISVYGSDQPGIVYRVTRALADCKVNITDLNTRLIGTKEEPVYVLMLEVILPAGMTVDSTAKILEPLSNELNIEIGVRAITPVSL